MRKVWVYDPQSGGVPIPNTVKPRIKHRILVHAEKCYAGKFNRIDVRFRAQFCYIDAYTEPYVPENFNAELFGESREEHIERLRSFPTIYADCATSAMKTAGRWPSTHTAMSATSRVCSTTAAGTARPEEAFGTSAVYLTE